MKAMKEADIDFRKGTQIRPIKFVERAGMSLINSLVESNPWGDSKCGRVDCFICRGEKGSIKECMKESVLYNIRCDECKERGKKAEYGGGKQGEMDIYEEGNI